MSSNQVYYSSNNSGPSKGRRILVVVGLFVIIALAIAFFLYSGRSTSKEQAQKKSASASKDSGSVLPLGLTLDPVFIAPKDMKGFVKQSDFTVNVGDYTTDNNGCNIQYGVVPGSELPGTTPQSIAINHLGSGTNSGATGGDPIQGKDLILKDAGGKQRYLLPTYKFNFSRDGVNYLASYSVVIMPGDIRAYVRTYCANTGDGVSSSAFAKVNDKAKEITVQTE